LLRGFYQSKTTADGTSVFQFKGDDPIASFDTINDRQMTEGLPVLLAS